MVVRCFHFIAKDSCMVDLQWYYCNVLQCTSMYHFTKWQDYTDKICYSLRSVPVKMYICINELNMNG